MKLYIFFGFTAALLTACDNHQVQNFQVAESSDPGLASKVQTYVPRLVQACPGLDRYSTDFTTATVDTSATKGYEGGIELQFRVVPQPQQLPAPLNVRSAQNTCYISINIEGSKAYIGKSACHSICEGTWQENSPGLMGREFVFR